MIVGWRTAAEPMVVNNEANCRVKPSKSMANTQNVHPSIMYGLRRPKRDLQLSARTPEDVRVMAESLQKSGHERTNKRLDNQSRNRPRDEHKRHM